MAKPYDYQLKIILTGDSKVGRKELLRRFCDDFEADVGPYGAG